MRLSDHRDILPALLTYLLILAGLEIERLTMALLAVLSIPSILALVGIGIVITRDTWVGGRNWKP